MMKQFTKVLSTVLKTCKPPVQAKAEAVAGDDDAVFDPTEAAKRGKKGWQEEEKEEAKTFSSNNTEAPSKFWHGRPILC